MSRISRLNRLRSSSPSVLPSMLMCDFGNLEREVRALEAAGAQTLHLDVMDGMFVPNLSYGMPIVHAFRRLTDLTLDVHLMMVEPQRYVSQFIDAGADMITFHIETVTEPLPLLDSIREQEVVAGVALNPKTDVQPILKFLSACDAVLVMSVEAGFGGQSFQPVALEKVAALRAADDDSLLIEIDGGINQDTIHSCAKAGADLFVVGSGIFGADDYAAAIQQLTALAS